MRRSFSFHDLSYDEFEALANAICQKVLGTGAVVFATGKDGGRDGAFAGTAQQFPSSASPYAGRFIIQAKHTANPAASCSDAEFEGILEKEGPRITALIEGGEIDYYLVFTNRKKPATSTTAKEKALKKLGIKAAHIIGIEQLRAWLTASPEIWSSLGFDRFDKHLEFDRSDITDVITAFHASFGSKGTGGGPEDLSFVPKPKKNKINKMSDAYFEEIRTRSLPYFKQIEDFLKNPRNVDAKGMYDDTADEIRRKLIVADPPFPTFDEALTHIIDVVAAGNIALRTRKRFAAIFMHYMYYTCDIGQHADPV